MHHYSFASRVSLGRGDRNLGLSGPPSRGNLAHNLAQNRIPNLPHHWKPRRTSNVRNGRHVDTMVTARKPRISLASADSPRAQKSILRNYKAKISESLDQPPWHGSTRVRHETKFSQQPEPGLQRSRSFHCAADDNVTIPQLCLQSVSHMCWRYMVKDS